MTTPAPDIDHRTVTDINRTVRDLLKVYAPAWKEFDPSTGQATGVSGALVGIFARFSEIIIQRLNQVPQKNFLAFLDMLGASLLPPQPARAPLTFSLAAGSAVDGFVPAGTQVAAPPAEGEADPVIFETERELVVTAAQLVSLFVRDPEQDQQADRSPIIAAAAVSGLPMFQGDQPIEHVLYLGHNRMLGLPQIAAFRLIFTLEATLQDSRELRWEIWDGAQWQPRTPVADQTQNLTRSGSIVLGPVQPIPETVIDGIQNRWVRGRLITPISIASEARLNMVRATQLPRVRQVRLEVQLLRSLAQGLSPDAAFTNAVAVDSSKDFFPFGEEPKLSDAFYIASAEAFSKDSAQGLAATGATVQLEIGIANSHLLPSSTGVRPSPDLQLAWECWNGSGWQRVGTSDAPGWLRLLELEPPPGLVPLASLVLQGRAQPDVILTAEISSPGAGPSPRPVKVGDDGRFALTLPKPQDGVNVIKFTATLSGKTDTAWAAFFCEAPQNKRDVELIVQPPPLPVTVSSIDLVVAVTGTEADRVTIIRVTDGSKPSKPVERPKGDKLPLTFVEGRNEFLIEGLLAPNAPPLAATTLTVSRVANPPAPEPSTGFVDGTYALCQSGIVTLAVPNQVASTAVNGEENFWLRARLISGNYGREATYRLKNPEVPEEGFILVLESFRPPLISSVRIGYQQTLVGPAEAMLAQNNSTFAAVANAVQPGAAAFEPFIRAPEARPTLYAGFILPPERAVFPNRPISLYARVEGLKYNERAVPISPDRSKESGIPALPVSHRFFVTNPAPTPARFTFSILGTRWQPAPVVPPPIDVGPGESKAVEEVLVTIPAGTPPGDSDSGLLRLSISNDAAFEHSAAFITVAGSEGPTSQRLRVVWEYWNGAQWSALTVRDETENFTRPGLVEFLPPRDFISSSEFGLPARYWLRVRHESGEYVLAPRLRRVLLNTTIAAQTETIRNEILGSSDGSANQKFRSTRKPILAQQKLEVQEPEMPSTTELEVVTRDEGKDAIALINDAAGQPKEIWVRWHEVSDFYGSGPRDRHYVLDHLTGVIRTGDGLNGLIPPAGIGNIRLARYQTGGGNAGNKSAGAIVQLKTTIPYVDKVTNTEAAEGGADGETLDSLLTRSPRAIRHHNRAVTVEDYEDLAMLASPEVARVKGIPLRNLIDDPLGERPAVRGEVSVIIVPRSREAKPLPSLELLSRVRNYLEARSLPTARVSVVGPLYIRVDIKATIALASLEGASAVEQAVQQVLAAFLHPLTGGLDGAGWEFGRKPQRSDLYNLLEAVPGVDHIQSLKIPEPRDQEGVIATGRFLVFSGTHTISLVFES
jgi:hypothetical protein